jgi:hypothetical protein
MALLKLVEYSGDYFIAQLLLGAKKSRDEE